MTERHHSLPQSDCALCPTVGSPHLQGVYCGTVPVFLNRGFYAGIVTATNGGNLAEVGFGTTMCRIPRIAYSDIRLQDEDYCRGHEVG